MFRRKRIVLLAAGVVVALAAGAFSLTAALGQGSGQVTSNVSVSVAASRPTDDTVTYKITIANKGKADVQNLKITGAIPQGSRLVGSWAGVEGENPASVEGGVVAWYHDSLAAGAGDGPFAFTVTRDPAAAAATVANVSWSGPDQGSAVSALTSNSAPKPEDPRRGCTSCHVPGTRYALASEAKERAEIRGGEHPDLPLDTPVSTCLNCHAPGTGDRLGMGVVAPLALRDIVHPAHMSSSAFKEHYGGSCFTCHNVDGNGKFVLLGEKLETNEKGVPDAPIQGIPPSEGNR